MHRFRTSLIIAFTVFLSLVILGKVHLIFAGYFTLRKWLWYLGGLIALVLFFSETKIGIKLKAARTLRELQKPALSFVMLIIIAFVWTALHPRLESMDIKRWVVNNKSRFDAVVSTLKAIRERGSCQMVQCTFTGKIFTIYCTDSLGDYEYLLSIEGQKDSIHSFMFEYDVRRVELSGNTILFDFLGGDDSKPVLYQYLKPKPFHSSGCDLVADHFYLCEN